MPRICYWNIAKVGDGSPPEKMDRIVTALRNFWIFWPTYYLFSEVSRAWLAAPHKMTQLASRVLDGNWLADRVGYRYCVIDPHVASPYTPETASEGAAIVIPNNVPKDQAISDNNLLTIWNPLVETEDEYGRVSKEFLPGVRRPVRFNGRLGVEIYIHHPSPMGTFLSFKTLIRAMHDLHRADPNRKLLVVGDYNVQANEVIPRTNGVRAPAYAHQHGLVLAPPDHDTHDDGKIDYAIHTPNIKVGPVMRLHRDRAASDHYPIYFDYRL